MFTVVDQHPRVPGNRHVFTHPPPSPVTEPQNVFNVFIGLIAILGVVAFGLTLSNNVATNDRFSKLDVKFTQKCVEVLELQTLANRTEGAGASLATGAIVSVLHQAAVPFAFEAWDDADFWSLTNATNIYLPSDGRYALGLESAPPVFPNTALAFVVRITKNDGLTSTDVCEFFTASDPTDSYISTYGYCERELVKAADNRLQVILVSTGASSFVRVKFSIRRLGDKTGAGITAPP